MRLPPLYPILDTAVFEANGFSVVIAAQVMLQAGVKILQYRHKSPFTEARFEEAKAIAGLCREASVPFIMNDRADFAARLGAGLHVGQHDLPPAAARKVVGPGACIGFSTHNEEQLQAAASYPIDYLALGPIFSTTSKLRPDPEVGLPQLRHLAKLSLFPLVAIGGIRRSLAGSVLDAGAASIAIISDLLPKEPGDLDALRLNVDSWLQAVDRR